MRVDGDVAKFYNAVRLDNFMNANVGELVMADDVTGEVSYKDQTGETKSMTLGQHAIKILSSKIHGGTD
jgi:hypothetical protein